jgi:tRNA dimethylallyltransferase
MPLPPQAEADVRTIAEQLYDERGPAAAHATLAAVDAPAAAVVHPNDRRRVVRALELAETGHTLAASEDRLWSADTRHPTLVAGLAIQPAETARRITARTAAMFAAGVVDEVRAARAAHVFSSTAERIHGLQDVSALLAGEIDREEAIRRLEARTRRYAKRQRTWMRRLPDLRVVDAVREPRAVAGDIAGWA